MTHNRLAHLAVTLVIVAGVHAPLLSPQGAVAAQACVPTRADALGPFYKPGAPVRSKVGSGHVLRGTVRSAANCAPIPGARVEVWMAGPDGEYADEYRATVIADAQGRYRFESHVPPPYAGRPSHIHVRASAAGFQTLVTQYYPSVGQTEGTFDLVLVGVR
ncbi:MAG: carboxypeptidase regulatory-like domain-containing protein [Armatimonadota bacterium]|nr:carboxypeptidase regulatory-like domain-containing protein [Armatimonadota bacterium]